MGFDLLFTFHKERDIQFPGIARITFFALGNPKNRFNFCISYFFVIFTHSNVESRKDKVEKHLFVAEEFGLSSVQVR